MEITLKMNGNNTSFGCRTLQLVAIDGIKHFERSNVVVQKLTKRYQFFMPTNLLQQRSLYWVVIFRDFFFPARTLYSLRVFADISKTLYAPFKMKFSQVSFVDEGMYV